MREAPGMEATPLTYGLLLVLVGAVLFGIRAARGFQADITKIKAELKEDADKDAASMRTQIAAIDAKAMLALSQVPEVRAEIAERYVTKEGFRDSVENLKSMILTGFSHLTESAAANYKHLDEKLDWLAQRIGQSSAD